MANLVYSNSPHIKSPITTKWIMINVLLALLPATVMGIVYFGYRALLMVIISLTSAGASEFIYYLIMGKKFKQIAKEFDFSSLVTGLLIALTIGTNYPLYAPILGSAFAIIVVKLLFGGTGKNLVNPAIVGRIFIFISFQWALGAWVYPSIGTIMSGEIVSTATPLAGLLESGNPTNYSILDLFLGTGIQGCIGETCKLALLIGAIYLTAIKVIDIRLPLVASFTVAVMTLFLYNFNFSMILPQLLSGGLILGFFFMATDYTTTPNSKLGNYIYFVLLGIVTSLLRYGAKMEVVSFAILLMNLLVPLIDKFVFNTPFGKPKKVRANKNEKVS